MVLWGCVEFHLFREGIIGGPREVLPVASVFKDSEIIEAEPLNTIEVTILAGARNKNIVFAIWG